MKKLALSLLSFAALNAEVIADLNLGASTLQKDISEGTGLDSKVLFNAAASIQAFKLNDPSDFVGFFRYGGELISAKYSTPTQNGDLDLSVTEIDFLIGYGFNVSSSSTRAGVNILGGINFGTLNSTKKCTSCLFSSEISSDTDYKAVKLGLSYFNILTNGYYANAEVFFKHYLSDDFKQNFDRSENAFEGQISFGYKFKGLSEGAFAGAYLAYKNSILSDKLSGGVKIGYKF